MPLTNPERTLLQRTVAFACKSHTGQFRKHSGLPYIVHPMAVMSQISEWGIEDIDIWRAALCHDILEDCPDVTVQQMKDIIGENATKIVSELTFIYDNDSDLTKQVQKEHYMNSFRNKSIPALTIKVADRICNTYDFLCTNPDYALEYWDKAVVLFNTMIDLKVQIGEFYGNEAVPSYMQYTRTKLGSEVR